MGVPMHERCGDDEMKKKTSKGGRGGGYGTPETRGVREALTNHRADALSRRTVGRRRSKLQ